MTLRTIALYLNVDEYPQDYRSTFIFRNRYICNYLERRVRTWRFEAAGFNRICVQGRHNPGDRCPIVPENAAVAEVRFDKDSYDSLSPGLDATERHEFLSEMLAEGDLPPEVGPRITRVRAGVVG